MKLSIVVPCFNEEKNIPLILSRFAEVIKERQIDVIMVNNGSTDNTAEILMELLPMYSFARTVNVPVNKGYGYGILQGLKQADGEYIGWTHADMQADPHDVVKAYSIICKHKGEDLFVKGNRQGRPFFDMFFTNGMSLFESWYFRVPLSDINAQPNVFPRAFFEKWKAPPNDFALDLYAMYQARKMGIKIVRFPVKFTERIHGTSKWNTGIKSKIKFVTRTIRFSRELKRKERMR